MLPYMGAVFLGRALHYLVTAILVVYFGPEIVSLILYGARGHSRLIMIAVAALMVAFVLYGCSAEDASVAEKARPTKVRGHPPGWAFSLTLPS